MKKFFILLLIVFLFSCTKKLIIEQTPINKEHPNTILKTYHFELAGENLSENVSRLSSQNDELVILVYNDTIDQNYAGLVFQDYFVFDSLNTKKVFVINNELNQQAFFTFVLIEMDSKKNIDQIEPIIRINLKRLLNESKNSKMIRTLLGDDDLLGIDRIRINEIADQDFHIIFDGIHLFDSYKYILKLKP